MLILQIFLAVVIVALTIYLLWRVFQKSVSFYKETHRGRTTLYVSANCVVKKITVLHTEKKGKVAKFVRTDISKGEEVEFVFPSSKFPEKLIVECDRGRFEYEVD